MLKVVPVMMCNKQDVLVILELHAIVRVELVPHHVAVMMFIHAVAKVGQLYLHVVVMPEQIHVIVLEDLVRLDVYVI
jgi:hypothetical protein